MSDIEESRTILDAEGKAIGITCKVHHGVKVRIEAPKRVIMEDGKVMVFKGWKDGVKRNFRKLTMNRAHKLFAIYEKEGKRRW